VRSFIIACVATVVMAVFGAVALEFVQQPVSVAFATTGAHL
jgi:hypothetical protein